MPIPAIAVARFVVAVASLAVVQAASAAAAIPGLPNKPIRLIVGTAPGGVPDALARVIAQQVSASTGQTFIVENRVGAGGLVAVNSALNSEADGTSLVLAETGSYAIAPHLNPINPFENNFKPVVLLATAPIFLVTNSKLQVSSVKELIAAARAKPGMPYGSSGNGSSHHLAMELFKSMAKVDLTHIPYKGAAQTAMAVTSNEVNVAFLGMNTAVPQAKTGRINILAVASKTRNSLMPDVPTIAEAGVPGYDIGITLGLFTPAATPQGTIDALNKEFSKALSSPAVREKLAPMGVEVADGTTTPAQYTKLIQHEFQVFGKIVKDIGLKID